MSKAEETNRLAAERLGAQARPDVAQSVERGIISAAWKIGFALVVIGVIALAVIQPPWLIRILDQLVP